MSLSRSAYNSKRAASSQQMRITDRDVWSTTVILVTYFLAMQVFCPLRTINKRQYRKNTKRILLSLTLSGSIFLFLASHMYIICRKEKKKTYTQTQYFQCSFFFFIIISKPPLESSAYCRQLVTFQIPKAALLNVWTMVANYLKTICTVISHISYHFDFFVSVRRVPRGAHSRFLQELVNQKGLTKLCVGLRDVNKETFIVTKRNLKTDKQELWYVQHATADNNSRITCRWSSAIHAALCFAWAEHFVTKRAYPSGWSIFLLSVFFFFRTHGVERTSSDKKY